MYFSEHNRSDVQVYSKEGGWLDKQQQKQLTELSNEKNEQE